MIFDIHNPLCRLGLMSGKSADQKGLASVININKVGYLQGEEVNFAGPLLCRGSGRNASAGPGVEFSNR